MDTDMTAPGFERIVPKHAPLDRIAYGLQFGAGRSGTHARALCSGSSFVMERSTHGDTA